MQAEAKVFIILGAIMITASTTVCLFSYVLIYKHVKKSVFSLKSEDANSQRMMLRKKRQKQDEMTITKNLMFVICGFFACVGPFTSLCIILPFLKGHFLNAGIHASAYAAVLIIFDSCLNPLI